MPAYLALLLRIKVPDNVLYELLEHAFRLEMQHQCFRRCYSG